MRERHHDPRGQSIGGTSEPNRLAPEGHPAGVRANGAGDHVHQGRFACTVLTDNGMNPAADDIEIRVVIRDNAVFREALDYVGGCEQHVGTQFSGISR
jgi:hypothetical protein